MRGNMNKNKINGKKSELKGSDNGKNIPRKSDQSKILPLKDKAIAGILIFLVGGIALMGFITAEVLYPGYSTEQEISDLGASRPPDSVIKEPSATIFNTTMMICGIILLTGTFFIHRIYADKIFTIFMGLFGLGILGVGVFPGNITPWHGLFALLTFVSGGIVLILSKRVVRKPFKYLGLVFGTISLGFLASAIFLGDSNPLYFLGLGGIERWVVYPIILWMTGFGGYLLGDLEELRDERSS